MNSTNNIISINIRTIKDKIHNLIIKNKVKNLERKFKKHTSSKFILDTYTVKELRTNNEFQIFDPNYKKEYKNLILTKTNAIITLGSSVYNDNELNFFCKLSKTIKKLEKHNRPYNIKIAVKDYKNLEKSGILNLIKNINLIIYSDFETYTKEEYKETHEKLNNLIKPIKKSNLSPYEKYLAVYNIVKKIKPYKDNPDRPRESRSLKYILNPENEYIVCVGYAKLLEILLEKVGVSSMSIPVLVDTSYDEGFTMECLETNLVGHQRTIVKIDDTKYGIHGIYIADPTWDNSEKFDLYNNSAMTFDKRKGAYRLEALGIDDLLLDFHSFKEFNEKINYYLKREIKKSPKEKINQKITLEYGILYNRIMSLIKKLDYSKYEYFNKKYQNKIDKITKKYEKMENVSLKDIEEIYTEFLTEYANYIIPLSNKEISNDVMFKALLNVKKEIDGFNEENLKEWEEVTKNKNEYFERENFPYIYNPNESRTNFLIAKENIKTKNLKK